MMRLHHKTHRVNCDSIAEHGFHHSDLNCGQGFPAGVYMSPPGKVWSYDTPVEFDDADGPHVDSAEEVVFAFDIPDDLAVPFGVWESLPPDPDTGESHPEVLYEYIIPASMANRYCVGPVAWEGEPPLSPEQLAVLTARCSA